MDKYTLIKLKRSFEQMQNKVQDKLNKTQELNQQKKQKQERINENGTKKVYYEIWKQIIKNLNKNYFEIFVYMNYDEKEKFFVYKIKVDNVIKKITRVQISFDGLSRLLSADGLDFHISRGCKDHPNRRLFIIAIPRYKLEQILNNNEQIEQKIKNYI